MGKFEHLERASESVDSWPEWKKELAGIPYVPQTHPVMVSTIKDRGIAVQVKGGVRILIPFEYAEATGQAILLSAARKREQQTCKRCNGTGEVDHYYDAGDHFGAGTSPHSEWVKKPCPECQAGK